jgi:broad specificity phosphatase PhoE
MQPDRSARMSHGHELPVVYLARHGETAWTLSGQHTGRTDLPLTENGERNARQLGERLKKITFAKVWSSPLQRARKTCDLAGFTDRCEIDQDLLEWDYGKYEGITSADIRKTDPNWDLFTQGAPGGETPAQISARADRVVARVRAIKGNVLLFSSGHILRVVASRWASKDPTDMARYLILGTASLSALSYEGNLSRPGIKVWNDTAHVSGS